jgi:hypothetical protein
MIPKTCPRALTGAGSEVVCSSMFGVDVFTAGWSLIRKSATLGIRIFF